MFVPLLHAQPATPHLGYVYPAGGRQGTTFTVTLGGQFLIGATNGEALISGGECEATVLEYSRPLTPQQANTLRDKLKELQEKRAAAFRNGRRRFGQTREGGTTNTVWTMADERAAADIRQKLLSFALRRNVAPAIAETLLLRIAIPAEAVPGRRELRLRTPTGLSNPIAFEIGHLPEVRKKPGTVSANPATVRQLRNNLAPRAVPPSEMEIAIPCVVNGQILQGGVDRYRFTARKGQRLVVVTQARELMPYLADAVPGWFQAAVSLYSPEGEEVAYADHFRFHPDPVLEYGVPRDGEYVVQIRDSIYRGREDFVYRVTVGELAYVTDIFPLGGGTGAETAIELSGWNLSKTALTRTNLEPGIALVGLPPGCEAATPPMFEVSDLPEVMEQEPNDAPAGAQRLTLPAVINGRIQKAGDCDVFSFGARASEHIIAEVRARRLNSPLDSELRLTDANGRLLAANDDHEDKGAGLETHYADSCLDVMIPTNGTYYLQLRDIQGQGGREYAYRLRVSGPRPDFALRVVPSSVNLRAGTSVPLTVYALRRDGFTNAITLALSDAPAGFVLGGGTIPPNQDQVRVTLTAPPRAASQLFDLHLEGRARGGALEIVRPAVPAEDMMQAFAYRHLVPAQELKVALSGRSFGRTGVKVTSEVPVKVPVGGAATVRLAAGGGAVGNRVKLELNDPPEGLTIQKVSVTAEGVEVLLQADGTKIKPGLKGNLIVEVLASNTQSPRRPGAARNNNRRISLGTLPALPFEIVAPAP